jgi:hypothetical protein
LSYLPLKKSWLVWICLLEKTDSDIEFIYGLSAESTKEAGWCSEPEELFLIDGYKLVFKQSLITEDAFESLLCQLEKGCVDVGCVFEGVLDSYQVCDRSTAIQPALGHSTARVDSFFTLPDLEGIFGENLNDILPIILSALQDKLNIPFRDSYSSKFGCFEVMHLNEWLDLPVPFNFDLVRSRDDGPDNGGTKCIEVSRSVEFANQKHTAHIICKFDGDTILNRFVELAPHVLRSDPITSPRDFDEYEAWLFCENGEIIHHEHHNLIREIGGGLNLQGRQVQLSDNLTRRAQQVDPDLGKRAAQVRSHSSYNGFSVKFGFTGPSLAFSRKMKNLVSELFPEPSRDKWFPKTVEAEVSFIEYFRTLLDRSRAKKAILVDPFFGVDALKRFALRLESSDLELTIVTSWTEIEPDTGNRFAQGVNPTDSLDVALVSIAEFINPQLKVINIHAKGKKAFHDRYLLTYPPEGLPEVFLLSNSLNKASGNWPFCMSLLAFDVSREVCAYVEGLCRGEDLSGSVNPTIDYRWPQNVD